MLLALLLMAAMTAVGIGLAVLIVGELKASSNIDHSIVAYYGAETGVEWALLRVKTGRANDTLDETINGTDGVIRLSGILAYSDAEWETSQSSISESIILTSLPKNKSVELDLFNPDVAGLAEAGGVESVKFYWSDSCSGRSWLEIGYVFWNPGLKTWSEDKQAVYKNTIACGNNSGKPCEKFYANYFDDSVAYKLRVKALYCDVENLQITAYDRDNGDLVGGLVVNIPSRIYIKSIGTYADSQIALTASTPWFPSILGLFDYAIFSEEDLDKPR